MAETKKENRFEGLKLWTPLLFVCGGLSGIFTPLIPVTFVFAVIFLSAVIIISVQYLVDEMRKMRQVS